MALEKPQGGHEEQSSPGPWEHSEQAVRQAREAPGTEGEFVTQTLRLPEATCTLAVSLRLLPCSCLSTCPPAPIPLPPFAVTTPLPPALTQLLWLPALLLLEPWEGCLPWHALHTGWPGPQRLGTD